MQQEELFNVYNDLKEGINAAPESTVPFPVVKDNKMSVIGDANETQINQHDFKIIFRFPKSKEIYELVEKKGWKAEEEEHALLVEAEYKDIFITPRQSGKVVSSVCRMLPFFRKIVDKGVEDYSVEDVVEMLAEFGDDFVDDMYDLVGKVLKIDSALLEYMIQTSAVQATSQIITGYPEIINEAEAFFS